jgi:putative transcriptional regulator
VKSKRKQAEVLSPRVREMVAGLHAACDAIEAGVPLERVATVRTYQIDVTLPTLSPGDVQLIRESLGLSLAQFAGFLGVSLTTVRAWELGQRQPSGPARRFLGEIRDDPASWRAKLVRKTRLKKQSPEP